MSIPRTVVLFLSLAFSIALFNFCFGSWGKLNSLVHSGVKAIGVIDSTNCQSHGEFAYSYNVNGTLYKGSGNTGASGSGNAGASKPCHKLQPADRVTVVYLPSEPSLSVSGDPLQLRDSWVSTTVTFSILFPALITVGVHRALWRLKNA